MMKVSDLLFITILIIIISIIIGLGIIYVIDKKLGKIKIKIPDVKVKLSKNKDGTIICNNNENENKKNEIEQIAERIKKLSENDEIENFSENNSKENSENNSKEKSENSLKEKSKELENDIENKFKYNNTVKIVNDNKQLKEENKEIKKDKEEVKITNNNNEIYESYPELLDDKKLVNQCSYNPFKKVIYRGDNESSYRYNTYLSYSDLWDDKNDPSNYYKKNKKIMKKEDVGLIGYNYNEYTDYAKPHYTDMKIMPSELRGFRVGLDSETNIPVGTNYAFPSSPSYE